MAEDTGETGIEDAEDSIILFADGETHWLIVGEKFLSAMLAAEGYYPTPVKSYTYESKFDLMRDLEEDVILNSLWAIHPGIIDRLRREDLIIEERR